MCTLLFLCGHVEVRNFRGTKGSFFCGRSHSESTAYAFCVVRQNKLKRANRRDEFADTLTPRVGLNADRSVGGTLGKL